jgi:hypothetical protein
VVGGRLDPSFERAVDALVRGEHDPHAAVLAQPPALARARSRYGHRAPLLHYRAANGVEMRRQIVPADAPAPARLLLADGADPAATAHACGGAHDVLALLRTSAHPRAAGVGAALERELTCPR